MTILKLLSFSIILQIQIPYRPIDAKLTALSADRDKLPSGKQILALTLTYGFWLVLDGFPNYSCDKHFLTFSGCGCIAVTNSNLKIVLR